MSVPKALTIVLVAVVVVLAAAGAAVQAGAAAPTPAAAPMAATGTATSTGTAAPMEPTGAAPTGGAPTTGPADAVQEDDETNETNETNGSARPDPESDVLGWEQGYWYDEPIDVDQSDGLTEAETEAYVSRAMARVEQIGRTEFDRDVNVTVLSREEYRASSGGPGRSGAYWAWNDQVWEGLFIVGEDTNVSDAFAALTGGAVLGFYSPSNDRLVVVSDTPGAPVIDNSTLVHELVHAVQDQRYDLTRPRYDGATQDEELAIGAVVEGEATLVEERYARLCGAEWSCVATPPGNRSAGDYNVGIQVTLLNQYSDGMAYLDRVVEREGWSAVERLHEDPPETTEQVIHAEPGEQPVPIAFTDRARNGWTTFEDQGLNGADVVGEASIYSMFWYQSLTYGAGVVDVSAFLEPDSGPYDYYNYTSEASEGWANDRLVPYSKGNESGYVWVTKWDTATDADQFREAYLTMLAAHGADVVDRNTWVVEEGPFADAFRIVRRGTTVTIVNGPDRAALGDIRPRGAGSSANATAGT